MLGPGLRTCVAIYERALIVGSGVALGKGTWDFQQLWGEAEGTVFMGTAMGRQGQALQLAWALAPQLARAQAL